MRGIPAAHGLKKGLFLAFALTAGLSLTACSQMDSMFGDDSDVAADAPLAADAGAPPTTALLLQTANPGGAPVATITPVTIDAGADTGTAVLLATHDDEVARRCDRRLHVVDGTLVDLTEDP